MEHKRRGRWALGLADALPFLAGAIILVAVPLVFILSYASSRYAAAICGSPSAEVSSPAASATPTPTPEATQEPEEAVCRYEEVELTEEDAYMLDVLDLAFMSVNREKLPANVLKEWVGKITDEISQISKIKRSDKSR